MDENNPASSKPALTELGVAMRDITQLIALTRITEQGSENLQERTGSTPAFTHSAVFPASAGVLRFKLENPNPQAIFEALKAAGRKVIFLRQTQEIAPAFPDNGIRTPGQPHLTSVGDMTFDQNTPADRRALNRQQRSRSPMDARADVLFAAERNAFTPQNCAYGWLAAEFSVTAAASSGLPKSGGI